MDTRDVRVNEETRTIRTFEDIWSRQNELYMKYRDIEGLPPVVPLDIDSPRHQIVFKDFLWRVTEELAEAFEEKDQHLRREEYSDALHFLVELMILVGIGPDPLVEKKVRDEVFRFGPTSSRPDGPGESYYWGVVYLLGLAGNCLKNKPWKQSQMFTDTTKFKGMLVRAFIELMYLFRADGMTFDAMLMMYESKSLVNQFRQGSGY